LITPTKKLPAKPVEIAAVAKKADPPDNLSYGRQQRTVRERHREEHVTCERRCADPIKSEGSRGLILRLHHPVRVWT